MDQESRHSLPRYLWFKVFHEVSVKLSARLQSSQGSAWRGSASKLICVTIGRPQVLVGCWMLAEDVSSLPRGPLCKAVDNMQLASLRANKEERMPRTEDTQTFCNLLSEVISHHFCQILVVKSESLDPSHI